MGDEREEADLQDFLKHMFMAKAEEISAGEPLSPLLQNPNLVGSPYNGTPSFQRPPSRHSSNTDINNTGANTDTNLRHPSLYAAPQEYHGQGGEARAMKQGEFYDDARLEANSNKRSQSRQVQAPPQNAVAFQPDSSVEQFGHPTEQQSQHQQERMRMQMQMQQQQQIQMQMQQQQQQQQQMQQIPQHHQMQQDQQRILQQTQQHHHHQQSAAHLSSQIQKPTSNQPPMANFPMQYQMSPTQMPYGQLGDQYAARSFHPEENLYRQEEEPHIVGLSRRARLRMLSGTPSDASESLESNYQAPHHQQQQQQQQQQQELLLKQQLLRLQQQLSMPAAIQTQLPGMASGLPAPLLEQLLRTYSGQQLGALGGVGNGSGVPAISTQTIGMPAQILRNQTKRKHSDMSDSASEHSAIDAVPPPPAHERIKGQLYLVKGRRKKWDGKRFARCCSVITCDKLAQGTTEWCKNHGGGTRCSLTGCQRAARGGSTHCAAHGGGKRCSSEGCNRVAVGNNFCRSHGGGRPCQHQACSAISNSRSDYCSKHEKEFLCSKEGCSRPGKKMPGSGVLRCQDHSTVATAKPLVASQRAVGSHVTGSPLVSKNLLDPSNPAFSGFHLANSRHLFEKIARVERKPNQAGTAATPNLVNSNPGNLGMNLNLNLSTQGSNGPNAVATQDLVKRIFGLASLANSATNNSNDIKPQPPKGP